MPEVLNFFSDHFPDFVASFILIAILILCRSVLLHTLARNRVLTIEKKRIWAINSRNFAVMVGLIGIIMIWSREIQAVALSMIAVAVALVVATKELIMCLCGSLMRIVTHSYTLGDHIEVGIYRGQVIDINFLSTTIMEIGPGNVVYQFSGRTVSIPNSILLANPVTQLNEFGDYIIHSVIIPVPFSVPVEFSEGVLLDVVKTICERFVEDAQKHMKRLEKRYLADTPSVLPRVALQLVDEKNYKLIARIAIPVRERHRIEQAIFRRFMLALNQRQQATS